MEPNDRVWPWLGAFSFGKLCEFCVKDRIGIGQKTGEIWRNPSRPPLGFASKTVRRRGRWRIVASTFLSAGAGDFPVASSCARKIGREIGQHGNTDTGLESPAHPLARKPALRRLATLCHGVAFSTAVKKKPMKRAKSLAHGVYPSTPARNRCSVVPWPHARNVAGCSTLCSGNVAP